PPPQPVVGAHHDAGDAIGALPRLVIDEGLLYAFGIVRLPKSFKGGHLRPVSDRLDLRNAGPLGDTVDDYRAGTGVRYAAAEFYAARSHLVAQDVQQWFRVVRNSHGRGHGVHITVEG